VFDITLTLSMHAAVCLLPCSTILVEPGWLATITAERNVRLNSSTEQQQQQQQPQQQQEAIVQQQGSSPAAAGVTCDPIQLAIFSHRYAEQPQHMPLKHAHPGKPCHQSGSAMPLSPPSQTANPNWAYWLDGVCNSSCLRVVCWGLLLRV
jgi:hypothetical protein